MWAFALPAIATLVKTYPIALLPVALLFVDARARFRGSGCSAAIGLVVLVPIAVIAHAGLYNAYATQWNRHLQLETIGSSIFAVLHRSVPDRLRQRQLESLRGRRGRACEAQTVLQVVGVAGAQRSSPALAARREISPPPQRRRLRLPCVGKVLSPQFLLWVAPLVVLSRSRLAASLLGAAMLLTNLLCPDRYARA